MPADSESGRYSIGELAELAGVSRRTVHFYVQRRLMDPPLGRGRGRHYDERHVAQIRRVRELQRLGVPLQEMAGGGLAQVAEGEEVHDLQIARPAVAGAGEVSPVLRIRIDENVTVEVAQTASLTPELIADLACAVGAIMNQHRGSAETDHAAEERRSQGATARPAPSTSGAGAEPALSNADAGAEPAPTASPGSGARHSEPEDEEEP